MQQVSQKNYFNMNGLKSFLFFNDLGQVELADYLGVSKAQMSKIVSGASPLRHEHLLKLLSNDRNWNTEFLTDPLWARLESGNGSLAKEGADAIRNRMEKATSPIPLIPFDAVAGPGSPVYEDERVEDYYTVSEFKESDFLIRVKGDSMSPHFTGGDLLACKRIDVNGSLYFLQWGRCYVIYTRSQGCMVKRVQPSEREGWIKCVSDNCNYAPFDVPMDDVVSVALVNGSISLE